MTGDDYDDGIVRQMRATGPVIGGAAVALTVLALGLGIFFIPRIEGMLFPIFADNDIPPSTVHRDGQKLCWTREGIKLRTPALTDIDIDVDYMSTATGALAHQPTPSLFDNLTGDELTSDDAPPAGPFKRRVCLTLARRIQPGQPVQVRQTAYFESPTHLYNVPVRFPIITDPPDAAAMFAERHDRSATPKDNSAVAGPRPSTPGQRSDADTLRDVKAGMARIAPSSDIPAILGDDTPTGEMPRIEANVTPQTKARVEQYRRSHSLRSGAAAVRDLLSRGLADDDRDALGPYEPGER